MITIKESTIDNLAQMICSCGKEAIFVIHSDYLEGYCPHCNKKYAIKIGHTLWNCCNKPLNKTT